LHNVWDLARVTSIGREAFKDCTELWHIKIPGNVTNIADCAFAGCTTLESVLFEGSPPSLGDLVFDGANKAVVYYMPGTTGWALAFGGRPAILRKPDDAESGLDQQEFIVCGQCGAKNRPKRHTAGQRLVCGKCKTQLTA
jgi:hypothetical protein